MIFRVMTMKLMVLDGNSLLNRAFYGIRPLTTADGLKFSTGPFEREDVSRDCGARHSCGIISENK